VISCACAMRFRSVLVRESFDVHVRVRFQSVLVREGFHVYARLR